MTNPEKENLPCLPDDNDDGPPYDNARSIVNRKKKFMPNVMTVCKDVIEEITDPNRKRKKKRKKKKSAS